MDMKSVASEEQFSVEASNVIDTSTAGHSEWLLAAAAEETCQREDVGTMRDALFRRGCWLDEGDGQTSEDG